MLTGNPRVSVIMPCLNEHRWIRPCLDSVVANEYPKDQLEVLVVDGMSDDGTRAILGEYAGQYPFVRMLDNPGKSIPRALNVGLAAARGAVIVRMDAHCVYAPDYISKSVAYLDKYKADNVGGIRNTMPGEDTVLGKAIAYSVSHRFSAGNATYRIGSKRFRWVDTVFCGCYRREVFERIGLFDEALPRGEDREFNARLRRAGGRILLAPDITCHYFARSEFHHFARWATLCGIVPFAISKRLGQVLYSRRSLVPPLFVLALLVPLLLSALVPGALWVFVAVAGTYLAACVFFSVPIAWKERELRFLVVMPVIFVLTHILYGVGAWKAVLSRRPAEPVREDPSSRAAASCG